MGIVIRGIFDKCNIPKTVAVIPAAGSGTRMNVGFNKLFLSICDKPVIAYTLDAFEDCDSISEIIIVANENEVEMIKEIVEDFNYQKVAKIVKGGATRQISVNNGISATPEDTEIIVIHDAARPLITNQEINDTIQGAIEHGIACSGVYPTDTVKGIDNSFFSGTYDRDKLFLVRTPQTFKKEILLDVLKKSSEMNFEATDESTLAELCGYKVVAVEGKSTNIKLTNQSDYLLISSFLTDEED